MTKPQEKLTLLARCAIATVALGGFLFGFHLAVIAGALAPLAKLFALSPMQEGAVVSILLIGACIGTYLGGLLADRLGRKWTIIITAIVFTIGALVTATAPDLFLILLGRFLTGLAVGTVSVGVPLYLAEIAPPSQRGTIVGINQLIVTVGVLMGYVVNFIFLDTENWRAMVAVGMVPSLLLAGLMFFFPETPEWLFEHGQEEQAFSSLRRLRQDKLWQTRVSELKRVASPRKDASWHRLFQPGVRFALFIAIMLNIFQQIVGINGVIYFAPKIFQEAGFTSNSAAGLATISIGVINIIMTFVAVKLLDRAGRRPLLLISALGMAFCMLVLSISLFFQSELVGVIAVVSLIAYVGSFAIGFGPIPWLISAEIFPLSVRGRAMSVGLFSNWLFNFIVAQTFLDLTQSIGSEGVFLIFAAFSVLAFFAVKRYVPETKGKSLEEIEISLGKIHK